MEFHQVPKKNNLKVTAVLPTYNNEKTIERCLDSLLKQSYKNLEIIAVDDGSKDNTVKILRKYKGIKVIAKDHTHRPENLNIGIKLAKGDVIFIVETDGYYEKDYLKKCLSKLKGPKVVGAIGKLYCTRPKENFWRKVRDLELRIRYSNYKPFTAWIYKKSILERVGGYDEDLYVHDDFILAKKILRLGYKFAWVPEAKWWHEEKTTLKDMFRQRMKWGVGYVPVLLKYHFLPPQIILFTLLGISLPFLLKSIFLQDVYFLFYLLFVASYASKAMKITKNPFYFFFIPILKIYRAVVTTLGFWFGIILKLTGQDLLNYT